MGFEGFVEFIVDPLEWQCGQNSGRTSRFLSLGSGNCDLEIQIVSELVSRGKSDFTIECLDINEAMLERGREAAERAGIERHLTFTCGDFNSWKPCTHYESVVAIQVLHHVVELEQLFAAIKSALRETGSFVVSDMIGRNGHLRWPEALELVQEFWRSLPPSYRYNQQLRRYEEEFEDWDCSQEGFEGIRSQDILPLLRLQIASK